MKTCTKCNVPKPETEFYAKRADCKECKKKQVSARGKVYYQENKEQYKKVRHEHYKNNMAYYNAKCAKRRAVMRNAKPSWVDDKELEYIYGIAKEKNLVVDHIVPLQHERVCGLHVPANLRCIPQKINAWKSNKLLSDEQPIYKRNK